MADELDDRLRDLARDAEPLVVIAGPQAVRRHGERRRARRRVAATGAAAALALAVGGWQLLPRLDSGQDTGAVTPAHSVTATSQLTALRVRLESALPPPTLLPYAGKWQWAAVGPAEEAKLPRQCAAWTQPAAKAEADRMYTSAPTGAVVRYQVLAYADAETARRQISALHSQLLKECAIVLTASGPQSDGSTHVMGASKVQPGVTVSVRSQGPYVAVVFLAVPEPASDTALYGGIEKRMAMSLATAAGNAGTYDKCKAAGLAGGKSTSTC